MMCGVNLVDSFFIRLVVVEVLIAIIFSERYLIVLSIVGWFHKS